MTKNNNEIVQWGYDLIQNFYLTNTEAVDERDRVYMDYLAPLSEKYLGPMNSVLLFGGSVDNTQLMKKNIWTVRDGLIPMTCFFAESTLKQEKLNLLLHKDLWFIVPEEWRKHVNYFDIKAKTKFSKDNLPKRIVMIGLSNETLADSKEFVEDIKLLVSSLGGKENFENIEVIGYFPNKRTDLWGRWEDENIFEYAKVLFKEIKIDIEFPEWIKLKSQMNYHDTLYYEINRGHFIKDTYTKHMFLSRGAGLLDLDDSHELMIKKEEINLSLYHSMVTYQLDEKNCAKYVDPKSDELLPYLKKIIEKGTNPRYLGKSWEKWFGTYIKKYYKYKEMI